MTNTKFVVKVNRGGTHAPEYVRRVDPTPIHMTTDRKLALVMGKFAAEDAARSIQNSRRIPELVSVQVGAKHRAEQWPLALICQQGNCGAVVQWCSRTFPEVGAKQLQDPYRLSGK